MNDIHQVTPNQTVRLRHVQTRQIINIKDVNKYIDLKLYTPLKNLICVFHLTAMFQYTKPQSKKVYKRTRYISEIMFKPIESHLLTTLAHKITKLYLFNFKEANHK